LGFPSPGGRRDPQTGMLYQAYQAQSDIMLPVRMFANTASLGLGGMLNGSAGKPHTAHLSNLSAAYELIARAGLTHTRPPTGSRVSPSATARSRCAKRRR
jgi:hypothetical protein